MRQGLQMTRPGWLRPRVVAILVTAVAVATSVSLVVRWPASASPSQPAPHKGPPASAHGHHWPAELPAAAAPVDNDPDACGPWSDVDTPSAAMQALEVRHGTITGCGKFGDSWVLIAEGSGDGPGEIGIQRCASPDCLDGENDRNLGSFVWYPAPEGHGLHFMGHPYGDTLILEDGEGEILFHVDSASYAAEAASPETASP